MTYRLLGGPFQILDSPFSGESHLLNCVLGASFEMSDALAKPAILHGAALVPEAMFDGFGFTPAEIKQYPNARFRAGAPAEFGEKYNRAVLAFQEYRAQLAQEQ